MITFIPSVSTTEIKIKVSDVQEMFFHYILRLTQNYSRDCHKDTIPAVGKRHTQELWP